MELISYAPNECVEGFRIAEDGVTKIDLNCDHLVSYARFQIRDE